MGISCVQLFVHHYDSNFDVKFTINASLSIAIYPLDMKFITIIDHKMYQEKCLSFQYNKRESDTNVDI